MYQVALTRSPLNNLPTLREYQLLERERELRLAAVEDGLAVGRSLAAAQREAANLRRALDERQRAAAELESALATRTHEVLALEAAMDAMRTEAVEERARLGAAVEAAEARAGSRGESALADHTNLLEELNASLMAALDESRSRDSPSEMYAGCLVFL